MADLFKWASETPAANLLLVVLIGTVVLTLGAAVILSIIAFFGRIPFEFFGFKVWTSARWYATQACFIFRTITHRISTMVLGMVCGHLLERLILAKRSSPPLVFISIIKFDVGDGIARLEVNAENVARNRFTIRFRTWENTRLYGASVSWIAIGH